MAYTFEVLHNGEPYYSGGEHRTRTAAREQLTVWAHELERADWVLTLYGSDMAEATYLPTGTIRTLRVEQHAS